MQASVAMMQASGDQVLQIVEGADGKAYRIDVPQRERRRDKRRCGI